MEGKSRYIPALSFRWLTPLYDPTLRWAMHEETFKRELIRKANIQAGQKVLDLGCGTGTLTIMMAASEPRAEFTGLDGDIQVLSIAERKALDAGVSICWQHASATRLPYAPGSFDTVVSSLVTHHLDTSQKIQSFREVHRVLGPGGAFHIVDFGRPFSGLTRLQAAWMRHMEESTDNFDGRIPSMLKAAGFRAVQEAEPMTTIFGPLWFYTASR